MTDTEFKGKLIILLEQHYARRFAWEHCWQNRGVQVFIPTRDAPDFVLTFSEVEGFTYEERIKGLTDLLDFNIIIEEAQKLWKEYQND